MVAEDIDWFEVDEVGEVGGEGGEGVVGVHVHTCSLVYCQSDDTPLKVMYMNTIRDGTQNVF